MNWFNESKAMLVAKEINNPEFLVNKTKFQKIKKRIKKLLWEDVFSVEEILQFVYKERKKLRMSLNKWEDFWETIQTYFNNLFSQYDTNVIFSGLYGFIEKDGISSLENIAISKSISHEEVFNDLIIIEELINSNKICVNNWNKLIIPIYKLIKIKDQNNIKWYISLNIEKWNYEKTYFLLNIVFRSLRDIISEIFEIKYKNITKDYISDKLTWALSRKYFQDKLKNDLLNKKENEDIYILYMDIDNFKKINDNFWHITWDTILKQFVNWIKESIRKGIDYVWRWWWEEFIIVFKFNKENIDNNEDIKSLLKKKIEKINEAIQPKQHIEWIDKITFSWWISSANELDYKPFKDNIEKIIEKLLNIADKRMYSAKNSWKNKVNFK